MNYGKLSEKLKMDAEVFTVASGTSAASQNYDMQNYAQAAIIVNVEGSYLGDVTLDLLESSAATAAGSSAAGSKVGIAIGASVNTSIPAAKGCRAITLTYGTASTGATGDNITLSLGTVTKSFYFSTATALFVSTNSSAWTTSKLYFGSTLGSTVDTGAQLSIDALVAAINSTKGFGNAIVCTTPTTNTLKLTVRDEAAGAIGFASTASTNMLVAMVNQAVGCFDIRADQLTSTANKRYIGVAVSTASTTCRAAVTVIRSGGRYMPASDFKGKVSS